MIGQVLGTMAGSDYTEGEIPWRSDFGSLLHLLRHRNNDPVTAELARVYIGEALARWIPQIRLIDVRTEKRKGPEGEENVLEVRIKYRIVGIQQAGNEVLGQPISQSVYLPA
jgi:phage baseplate assembly protein W